MALKKETQKAKASPKIEDEQMPKASPKIEDEPAAPREEMVRVNSRSRFHYVQPETGITIQGWERDKPMRNDAWLALQVKAGLLELT